MPDTKPNPLTNIALAASTTGQLLVSAGPGAPPAATSTIKTVAVQDKGGAVFHATAYGAAGDGTTDDTSAINAAITAASAAGGGIVHLPTGVYKLSAGLALPGNVHLRGAGRNFSRIILTASAIGPAVGASGQQFVTISDLWVDLATNSSTSNGIAFTPDALGNVCQYCVVDSCRVTGHSNIHAYMIWNQAGSHIKILNCFVDGGSTTFGDSGQTGIESQGGTDVLISGCTVQNIGSVGIDISNDGGTTYPGLSGVRALGNWVSGCGRGISVASSSGVGGTKATTDVTVANNQIFASYLVGISVQQQGAAPMTGVKIQGNTIDGVTSQGGGNFAVGILLWVSENTASPSTLAGNEISGNTILNIRGANAHALEGSYHPKWLISGNTIAGCDHTGIYLTACDNCMVQGNKVISATYVGIYLLSCNRVTITGGQIDDWDLTAIGTAGVILDTCTRITLRAVTFHQTTPSGYPVHAFSTSDQCNIRDVVLQDGTAFFPWNEGTNPATGTFTMTASATSTTVANTYCRSVGRIRLTQTAGPPTAFRASVADGSFTVTFAASAAGTEVFAYEILH